MELSHRGFSACILIDNMPIPIYRDEYDSHTGKLAELPEKKRIRTYALPESSPTTCVLTTAFHVSLVAG